MEDAYQLCAKSDTLGQVIKKTSFVFCLTDCYTMNDIHHTPCIRGTRSFQ
jgi:hypothetical protein